MPPGGQVMALFSTYQSTDLPLLSTLYEPPPKHLISVLGGAGGLGLGPAGTPLGGPLPHRVGHGLRGLRLRPDIRRGLLLGQRTGMHDDQASLLLGAPPRPVLALAAAADAGSRPTAWRFVLGPAVLLHEEGQGRVLAPP